MNALAKLLPLSHVLLDMDVSSKKRLFEQVGLLFENQRGIASNAVYEALFMRERLGSTGLGQEIAIPHGRIKGLREPVGALLRLRAPVPFESPDGKPVRLAFVMLVPENANQRHLELLSELAELFSDRELRARLFSEPETRTVHELFIHWQPHAANKHRAAG